MHFFIDFSCYLFLRFMGHLVKFLGEGGQIYKFWSLKYIFCVNIYTMVLKIEPVNESVWHLIPGFGQLLTNFGQLWVVLSDWISS